ncbi:predicted protein [Streptomyces sp. SPB78]|nr:predicted protein [Streptomyces sp. SPB78]
MNPEIAGKTSVEGRAGGIISRGDLVEVHTGRLRWDVQRFLLWRVWHDGDS